MAARDVGGSESSRPLLKAVIFDVDGVLVQSMEKHAEAYRRAFAPLGIEIAPDEVYANEGRRSREVIASLAKDRGITLTPEQLEEMNRTKQATFASFGPLPLYPGALELIDQIRERGLRVAIVTGTARVNVESHLKAIVPTLDAIVTADDVKRTKPDPEPYLAALAKLGVRANEAIVIENAPLGIRSATAAGIPVIAVLTTQPRAMLAEADAIVERLADVWTVLGGWLE